MLTQLSSRLTPVYTTVIPVLSLGMLGIGTALAWIGHVERPWSSDAWVFPAFLLLGCAFSVWFTWRVSEVWIDGDELLVIRWRYEERIPLSAVEEVSEMRMWNPNLIRARIRAGAASRDQVVFVPPMSFQLPFTEHRVARQLREAAQAHR
ncbi:MAG TPA: hypothetical protein VF625_15705 [Longimicrobium sp.]|jgi:hypothetical protein